MRFVALILLFPLVWSVLLAQSPAAPFTESSIWGSNIVAGEEGIVAVSFDKARAVAAAMKIQDDDKKGRMRLYEKLGRQPDFTLK